MKSIDIFCSSPASTAICSNSGKHATPRRWQDLIRRPDGGGHEISRFDHSRKTQTKEVPYSYNSSIDAIVPAFCGRRSTSSAAAAAAVASSKKPDKVMRRKSSADVNDHLPESSTYLLSDKPFLELIPDSGRAMASRQLLIRPENDCNNRLNRYKRLNSDGCSGLRSFSSRSLESPVFKPSPKGSNSSMKSITYPNVHESAHQVVELRVSIHCKGCEGKLRKHLSRMEGVTSFTIDLATKKVTVIGEVTPLGVLSSISKVKKYAEFWSPSSSSISSLRTSALTGVATAR